MLAQPQEGCCVDPACSHALVSAAAEEACKLSVTERQIILGVLKRNEQLQKDQQYRILRLKAELQILRRKGALKTSVDQEAPGPDPDRSCGRCRVELGRVINRGAYCRACRLKVCKGCREYSFRTTDWVCTVCHKHMEIQAASGEWMNEFVRRPSRRRDNRVYVPAADIIKRTIRRSWTISNPTPRWNALRCSPEIRPYNSLPRGQDISNYPSLAVHQTNAKNCSKSRSPSPGKHAPAKRSHSEDVYSERAEPKEERVKEDDGGKKRGQRVNPLIKYASERKKNDHSESDEDSEGGLATVKTKRKLQHTKSDNHETMPKPGKKCLEVSCSVDSALKKDRSYEKRVSFSNETNDPIEPISEKQEEAAEVVGIPAGTRELCDIEPISGTVFRKVTVRRRRQDMRKMAAVDTGWRRGADGELLDILLPEGDDYKLVFLSSDSSSKEEDVDEDSSSTASSFPIDECDWDYFEPGGRKIGRDEGMDGEARLECSTKLEKQSCQSCGAPTQYVPIPVPVPIPIPMPAHWNPQDSSVVLYDALRAQLRVMPRTLWPYLSMWPLISNGFISALPATAVAEQQGSSSEAEPAEVSAARVVAMKTGGDEERVVENDGVLESGYLESENKFMSSSSESDDGVEEKSSRSYNVNGGYRASDDDDALPSSDEERIVLYEDDSSCSSTDGTDSDVPEKRKKYSRVYVVNTASSESSDSENDGVILTCIKKLVESPEPVIKSDTLCDNDAKTSTSSPGLSDVSAESLDSSDSEGKEDPPAIRSDGSVSAEEGDAGAAADTRHLAGVSPVISESVPRHVAARYTSLVMITQADARTYAPVSVVTSDTTTLVADAGDVVVRHTNYQEGVAAAPAAAERAKPPVVQKRAEIDEEGVTVITGADTLSAVVCLEEGLADDDSWVETISHDEDDDFAGSTNEDDTSSGEEVTLHCTAAIDHEDELRGYHRAAIDFTLHTIVEESCEESEVEQSTRKKKMRPTSATDLEKYFYFNLGDGKNNPNHEDAFSETSSICSESLDSFGANDDNNLINENTDPADLASSRLEKYFLSGFTSFKERRDSDGSVGSDSEGRPSPEQRRKRLVRARGTGRSHSSSLDNLISNPDLTPEQNDPQQCSEDSSSSDTDTCDDFNNFEKIDGQFDTVKRKKNKKQKPNSPAEELKALETTQELNEECGSDEDGHKTPQPSDPDRTKQQSRDSGFIGSNDDLNRDAVITEPQKNEPKTNLYNISEEKRADDRITQSTPPATLLTRKDSFNNWSSDEETNLMMCKMRQFFKTMVANNNSSKPTTPVMSVKGSPKPSPRLKNRCKPPQLVYFENELTRLMKTVPGIRDDQVREIVEYLSSEDTWSDSYDSSDYTSSDLEGTAVASKSALQQQISDSCKQIINKFDNTVEDEEGDEGDGGIVDEIHGLNRETAFVYQKLVASFEKMATGDSVAETAGTTPHSSPPLIAKVMHHIGSRLVALMHEVSSGESHASNSPKTRHYHRRLQQKLSSASTTTTEDDDNVSDYNEKLSTLEDTVTSYNLLPRSRSHDLLVSENRNHPNSGVSDIIEERETSDCERFSWRGSFESALLATDSRNKLSLIGGEGSSSASALALAAKRRSAGDLLFTHKSLSREQLDRVRSCGSIGGANSEDKLWVSSTQRRSSVPDASCGSAGSADDEEDDLETRSTLPRSLQSGAATTNSLPRLPTNTQGSGIQKAQSMYHFLQQNVKSARYRPPGFSKLLPSAPKRAVSAPGLQPTPQRRGRRQQAVVPNDEVSLSEAHSSPMLASRTTKSATPSPVAHKSKRGFGGSQEWHSNEDDIDRLVAIHHRGSSFSNLGSRSDSMASVYSGAGEGRYGTVAVKGQVEFGLQYNYKAGALEINIKQCRDLAAVDTKRNRSDPYVKVYLLPDKSKSGKRKTKVKKHTLNPVFEECLKFHISLNGLETRTLWLTVWHSDMFGRNDFLGEVMMTLENKVFDDPAPKWYNLQERTEPFDDMLSFKGDILVGLKFVPPDMTVHKKGKRSRGALHVLVKEAKSLTAVKANGTSDPFCKSYLLPDKGRSSKQKTSVTRRTVNPVWNHTFVYDDVTLQELAERCLELTVWDHDRLASNEFLGGVRFSLGTGKHYGKQVDWMDATGKELTLWKSMLERPNFWVEGCLSLRPTLDHRTS